ncbi:hypothetical protein ACFQGW_07845 [Xanthomonas theicola]
MTSVIVGDRRKAQAPLRALGSGPVQALDSDGRRRDQGLRSVRSGPWRIAARRTAPALRR